MNKRDMWLWMAMGTGCRFQVIKLLMDTFTDIADVYAADEEQLRNRVKLTDKEIDKIIQSKKSFDVAKAKQILSDKKINFICVEDNEYPEKMLRYEDCPYFLFYKGKLPKEYLPIVAIVGARACSNYGRVMSKEIGTVLSQGGVQVISGMARGIDTYSQLGAISGGTPTFAVLGSGVDVCYPTENIELYEDIISSGGGIVSEYPPGTPPMAHNFPMRNRIISAYADKVVVVEAKEKSGSLITVEWALEQGKDIYAVPGRVGDLLSSGCNRLIKNGAGVLIDGREILEELNCGFSSINKIENCSRDDLKRELITLYEKIDFAPKSIQQLIEETTFGLDELSEMLLQLQLFGLIEEMTKNYYVRIK